jgi:hypothetical protein
LYVIETVGCQRCSGTIGQRITAPPHDYLNRLPKRLEIREVREAPFEKTDMLSLKTASATIEKVPNSRVAGTHPTGLILCIQKMIPD